eukprot:gene6065-4399_t
MPGGIFVIMLFLYQGTTYASLRLFMHTHELTPSAGVIGVFVVGATFGTTGVDGACVGDMEGERVGSTVVGEMEGRKSMMTKIPPGIFTMPDTVC